MVLNVVFWLFMGSALDLHPYHVSVSDIEHNEDQKSLQITQHIFLDDLEEVLRKRNDPKLDIVNPKDPDLRDEYVRDYVLSHISISVNGKEKEANYLGHEQEMDAYLCYIEVEGVKKMKSAVIQITLLTDQFDDQTNLVHLKYQGKIKSHKLDKIENVARFSYE